MALKAIVIATDDSEIGNLHFEDYELVDVLGPTKETVAIEIGEIVQTISESLCQIITQESELTIEIKGSISLKADGGAKWLFFNVGGGATKSDALNLIFKTKIQPQNKT